MIEFAYKIAYAQILGFSLINYFGVIVLAFLLASFITFKMSQKGRVSPEAHELVVYFSAFLTAIYAILQILLLL